MTTSIIKACFQNIVPLKRSDSRSLMSLTDFTYKNVINASYHVSFHISTLLSTEYYSLHAAYTKSLENFFYVLFCCTEWQIANVGSEWWVLGNGLLSTTASAAATAKKSEVKSD